MCQLFVEAESEQWLSRTKSLRIEGVVTSIRLENFFEIYITLTTY